MCFLSSCMPLSACQGFLWISLCPPCNLLWNHPLCWSLPSRYISAGQPSFLSLSMTAAWLTPESNQTSRMSISLEKDLPPHSLQAYSGGKNSSAFFLNHISAPFSSKDFIILSNTSASLVNSPQLLHFISVIGTPHDLCLEIHQSGLFKTIP